MKKTDAEPSHIIDLTELKNQENSFELRLDGEDGAVLADRLGVSDVREFRAKILIRKSYGIYPVSGRVSCEVEQECVLSLDRFWQPLACSFEEEFKVGAEPEPVGEEEMPEVTYVPDGRIDLWELALDYASLAVDPFPKRPGAGFSYQEFDPEEKENPFACLKDESGGRKEGEKK